MTVTIQFGRIHGGGLDEDKCYRLRIKDDSSKVTVCEISMNAEQLAQVLTGISTQGISVEWGFVGKIGMVREVKRELVHVPNRSLVKEAVAGFEVNGWKGRLEDASNHHKRGPGSDMYWVTYTRHVYSPENTTDDS